MCKYCEGIKRAYSDYLYCPMCGSLYNKDDFVPLYMLVKKINRYYQGMLVETCVKIKEDFVPLYMLVKKINRYYQGMLVETCVKIKEDLVC